VNDRNLRWAEGRVFVALLRQSCCERMQQDFSASGLGSVPPCGGAERTQYSRLFECRLSPLTFCRLAPAANVRSPPILLKNSLLRLQIFKKQKNVLC